MLDYSLNEAASKARLAVRGAGYSWGVSDEAARAVFWCIRRGLPALDALAHLLYESRHQQAQVRELIISAQVWSSADSYLCSLTAGCALADKTEFFLSGNEVELRQVLSPLLLTPFLADIATRSNKTMMLSAENASVQIDSSGHVTLDSNFVEQLQLDVLVCKQAVERSSTSHRSNQTAVCNRVEIAQSALDILNHFAANTFAPATRESRLLGAGAGENDND